MAYFAVKGKGCCVDAPTTHCVINEQSIWRGYDVRTKDKWRLKYRYRRRCRRGLWAVDDDAKSRGRHELGHGTPRRREGHHIYTRRRRRRGDGDCLRCSVPRCPREECGAVGRRRQRDDLRRRGAGHHRHGLSSPAIDDDDGCGHRPCPKGFDRDGYWNRRSVPLRVVAGRDRESQCRGAASCEPIAEDNALLERQSHDAVIMIVTVCPTEREIEVRLDVTVRCYFIFCDFF